ncbi:tetratricopeptide repeat protein [Gloeobacter kilaueensis]|uniref:Cellulose synthase subunit BcsC n=1 Tax=Gloeobacter kilaueensis (strain ATCC BAA-2537 / CCAP 1431/1 / ULC 316 / JS1) TaxID=1183438 RepID=U5QKP5_GLOK1|nr:tetratricopeptide repeat protein [Gloeobacter kilaueensis]AGY59491.1 cellulose synthase subunit BcsC [Gloeobacter kilaueensis JS1]
MPIDSLFLQLNETGDSQYVRLDCRLPGKAASEERTLPLAQIEDLLGQAERDFYVVRPDIVAIGKRLFAWLDGDERWLGQAVSQSSANLLVLHIGVKRAGRLRHLPWEALHDGEQFLVQRFPPVLPVRTIPGESKKWQPQDRPLLTVFMACSPEGVEPPLDFEREESAILQATADLPLQMRVEESGNLPLLGKRLERYGSGEVDILHLTGHAGLGANGPFFVAENEVGERQDVSDKDIARALQFRIPPLVFLSGCRTGQGGSEGAIPSMAEALVEAGATAVLGWGLPIEDTTATKAAAQLYEHLAAGCALSEALIKTYLHLLDEKAANWHLLRLHVRGECPGSLVQPSGDMLTLPLPPAATEFLDEEQQVRVATSEQFVGRRRLLQKTLKILQGSRNIGVVLLGQGGIGKSSLAARLLERLAEYSRIVLYRDLTEERLTSKLARQCESDGGHDILNGRLPTLQKWQRFFKAGLNAPNQRLAIVLDDFEANFETDDEGKVILREGKPLLKAEVVPILRDLLAAVQGSGLPHRLIITSRYDFTVADPKLNALLERFQVPALRGADLMKKCERLKSFRPGAEVDADNRRRALKLAAGNPRLLERLDKVLQAKDLDQQALLLKLEQTGVEYCEEILVEHLLNKQEPELRRMLECGRVYELPVPAEAFLAVCQGIASLERHIERARSLGLLEAGLDGSLWVPPLVIAAVPEPVQPLAQLAVDALYRCWWEHSGRCIEAQALEIYRLAKVAEQWEQMQKVADALVMQWQQQGRYLEAEPLQSDVLRSCRYLLGQEHPKVAASLNNLAVLYYAQGRYEEAEPLYLQALQMRQKLLGQEHPKVADSLNNLAALYMDQGRYEKAEPLYMQALQIQKKRLGQMHPQVAIILGNLARLYYHQGRYERAEPLFLQALQIQKKLLGQEHPDVAKNLGSLAALYESQGKYDKSELLFLQALQIQKKLLGQEHPDVARNLGNLAFLYYSQGRYEEAEPLYLQALQMQQKLLGQEHPDVAANLNNLGLLYYSQNQYEQAEPRFMQAIQMQKKLLGEEHPDLADSLGNLAIIKYSQKQYEEAEPLFTQVLQMQQNLLGQEHPVVAVSLGNLAMLYYSQGRYEEAEPLYLQALQMRQKLLGQEHPDVAINLCNLALLYTAQSRYEQAEPLYVRAVEVLLKKLGTEHPNTITVRQNYVGMLERIVQEQPALLEKLLSQGSPMTQDLLRQMLQQE